MLKLEKLWKVYPNGVKALKGISLEEELEGKVLGFIGENGAGKTTLVRILSTQLKPTSGKVFLFGKDVIKEARKIRELIATLPQDIRPYLYSLTPLDYITFYLRARGLSKSQAERKAKEILERLEIPNIEIQNLSGGMQRRVFLAMVLSSDSKLYFLDEPTVGLDPISRNLIWSIIQEKLENSGVLLTSHYLDEIAILADKVVLMKEGQIIKVGKPKELLKKAFSNLKFKIIVKNADAKILDLFSSARLIGNFAYIYEEPRRVEDKLLDLGYSFEVKEIGLEDLFYSTIYEQKAENYEN